VPKAIALIMTFVRDANAAIDREGATAEARAAALEAFNKVTGVLQIVPEMRHAGGEDAEWERARQMAEERKKAKWSKDWGKADQLRKALLEMGFEVRDTPDGGFDLRRAGQPTG
jgi:cysteinyl-tRNA synthetase